MIEGLLDKRYEITIDLDEDVEFAIQEILKDEAEKSFEEVVNELLRVSFADDGACHETYPES